MNVPAGRVTTQTHFIGVLANDELAHTLGQCRLWMGESFGCRSGFSTPIHATLVPPFAITDPGDLERLARAIASCARDATSFAARVSGFGAFGERTVFARVEPDPRWTEIRDALYATIARELPDRIRKDARPFVPHLTVANRDIPAIAVPRALEYFAHIGLDEDFPVDHIALFARRDGLWATERAWLLGDEGREEAGR